MEKIEKIIKQAATEAGKIILEHFQTNFYIGHKDGINNLVTEVDKKVERFIRYVINKNFPDHGIIGEEYEAKESKQTYKWVIDPIDGTTNFAHGLPLCCVSIGILKEDDVIMGIVYNPMLSEFFFAKKGEGAFLNEEPIEVTDHSEFETSFLVTGFPYHNPPGVKDITGAFSDIVNKDMPIRRLGAAAIDLCWVACGRFDGFWEYNLQPWDIAAGYLILREAGGKVTNFKGEQGTVWDKETLATNGKIHEALRTVITKAS